MISKEVKYLRGFLSETEQIDVSYHGSPIYELCQRQNKQDTEIRKDLVDKFALHEITRKSFTGENKRKTYLGFDGTQQYMFTIEDNLPGEDSEKNMSYQTKISITKAGSESGSRELSDLEKFLIDSNFKREK